MSTVVESLAPLVVGEGGEPPLPWLATPLQALLQRQRGHAVLLHGAPGSGVLSLALALAQGWLCEADGQAARRPCGRCGSCRLVHSRLHPDLQVLLPETLRRALEWPLRDDKPEGEDSKRKPSRQLRIDEVRGAIEAVQRTSARGRGKVVVLHPAEALNGPAANALLKTLEEPPEGTRIVLTAADPTSLLPTVRSRCQVVRLPAPEPAQARVWLQGQAVAEPEVLLAAAQGQPLLALALARDGVDAAQWRQLPLYLARGQGGAAAGWPLPRLIDALLKLCHDALALALGAAPRYFPTDSLPARADPKALAAWQRELLRVARHDEHPWNEALLTDTLLAQAARALQPRAAGRASVTAKPLRPSLH